MMTHLSDVLNMILGLSRNFLEIGHLEIYAIQLTKMFCSWMILMSEIFFSITVEYFLLSFKDIWAKTQQTHQFFSHQIFKNVLNVAFLHLFHLDARQKIDLKNWREYFSILCI